MYKQLLLSLLFCSLLNGLVAQQTATVFYLNRDTGNRDSVILNDAKFRHSVYTQNTILDVATKAEDMPVFSQVNAFTLTEIKILDMDGKRVGKSCFHKIQLTSNEGEQSIWYYRTNSCGFPAVAGNTTRAGITTYTTVSGKDIERIVFGLGE